MVQARVTIKASQRGQATLPTRASGAAPSLCCITRGCCGSRTHHPAVEMDCRVTARLLREQDASSCGGGGLQGVPPSPLPLYLLNSLAAAAGARRVTRR